MLLLSIFKDFNRFLPSPSSWSLRKMNFTKREKKSFLICVVLFFIFFYEPRNKWKQKAITGYLEPWSKKAATWLYSFIPHACRVHQMSSSWWTPMIPGKCSTVWTAVCGDRQYSFSSAWSHHNNVPVLSSSIFFVIRYTLVTCMIDK